MTSHQLLMQAVGKFWSQLENVRFHSPSTDNEYRCVVVRPNRETVIRSVEWTPDTLLPYQEFAAMIEALPMETLIDRCRMAILNALLEPRPRQQVNFPEAAALAVLKDGGANTFTVFFPGDDKLEMFAARTGSETCGLNRNIAWWAVKHGIEDSRIRNVHMEGNQAVISVMLLASGGGKKQSQRDGDGSRPVVSVSQTHDPTDFSAPGDEFRMDYEQPLR